MARGASNISKVQMTYPVREVITVNGTATAV